MWEVGSKHPVGVNMKKAWNLFLLILLREVPERPYTQEQTMNAHADMSIVVGYNELNTPRGIYRYLVSGA